MESILHWADYLVLAAFLAISLGIGIYHSLTGGRQKTTNEFIMADRALSVIPTSLSILVSYQSAIAILGVTAEIYSYGSQYLIWPNVASTLGLSLAGLIFVPWIYPLKLVSINEYIYLRFKSKLLTAVSGSMAITSGILYMGVAMFAPSAAFESVTGFPVVISIPLMAIVCVAYTTLGGMRAVIWTDVFQFFIMMGGITAIFVQGFLVIGGFENIFALLAQQNRVNWIKLTPDPRVRHTMWEFVIGSSLGWMFTYGISQASAQRYGATRSIATARLSILLNIPALWFQTFMLCTIGLIVTAYYTSIGCDPLANKQISNANQLLPFFVTKLFSNSYGFSGLFLATLYGGALSSVSSSLSGGAANCWKDILKWRFDYIKESNKALVTRALVVIFGALATGVAFLAATVPGPIIQVSLSLSGAISGPYAGLFMLGGLTRRTNWKSSFVGVICGLSTSVWLSIGAISMKKRHRALDPLPVSGCLSDNYTDSLNHTKFIDHFYNQSDAYSTQAGVGEVPQLQGLQNFYSISYLWFIMVGLLATLLSGFLASLVFCRKDDESEFDENLLIPWKRIFTFRNDESKDDFGPNDVVKYPPIALIHVNPPQVNGIKQPTTVDGLDERYQTLWNEKLSNL